MPSTPKPPGNRARLTPSPPPVGQLASGAAAAHKAPVDSVPRTPRSQRFASVGSTIGDGDAAAPQPLPAPIAETQNPLAPPTASSPVIVLPRVEPTQKGAAGVSGRRVIRVLSGTAHVPDAGSTNVTSSEVGSGQLVVGGGGSSARHDYNPGGGSHELAVVPFTPPQRLRSPVGDHLGVDPNKMMIGAIDSNQWALTTRRVCPTCLRPYMNEGDDADLLESGDEIGDEGFDDDDNRMSRDETRGGVGRSSRRRTRSRSRRVPPGAGPPTTLRRMLSPQYFRALEAPLAISDGSDRSGPSSTLPTRSQARPPTTSPERALRHPPALPPIYYVSPTGSPRRGDYGFPDVSVDPTHSLGVEWAGDESATPSNVRDTIPFRPKAVDDSEEEEKLLPDEQRESARRDNEEAKETSSPPTLLGSNGYYARYFVEVQKLGSGTYGGVYLCQHVMEGVSLGTFALKKVPVGDNVEYLQKVLSEVRILEEVKRHPNVVEYNHSWVEEAQLADFGPPVRCLFILMEYATEGSLDSYLERYGTALSTVAVWYFFLSAVAGTAHLHQKNILHRDLKPQNLLLTGPPGKPPRVLVSDFGTAALLGENAYERTGGTGTLEYMAPELMEVLPNLKEEHYVNHHTKASDVWSLGMILYYLACDATLPARLPDGSVALNIPSRSPFARPPEMVELIRAMLQRDPRRRPSCHDILSSTVVQTILRSFNSAAAAGSGAGTDGFSVITRDVMPCDDRGNSPTPPRAEPLPARRVRPFLSNGNEESLDETCEDDASASTGANSPTNPNGNDNFHDDNLQSSRVELMSQTVTASAHNLMEVPLLMQYRANDAAMSSRLGVPGGAGASRVSSISARPGSPTPAFMRVPQLKHRRTLSTGDGLGARSPESRTPVAKRPRMVDEEVQTDPVNIVD